MQISIRHSALDWYNAESEGLGELFMEELELQLNRMAAYPEHYPAIYRGIRRCLLRKFPFAVLFKAEEGGIVVLAIWHTSRNPDELGRRL